MNDSKSLKHISGIDGLRAIAVISVILFHLNPNILPGGFTGVDIFFVISGFVISQSLHVNKSEVLSAYIFQFYKRRLLRILPALIFCLAVTSFLSILFIPEGFWLSENNNFTALFSIFGFSNIYLVNYADGYFNARVSFNPYVHTWSLAVEEQFYFLFPLIFYLWVNHSSSVNVYLKICSRYLLIFLFLFSLVFSIYETYSSPDSAYYLILSRFWELASGGLLYQLTLQFHKVSDLLSLLCQYIGMFLILIVFIWGSKVYFPFPWALSPVVGTAMLIFGVIFGNNQNAVIFRFLNIKPMVFIGRLSYSLYLWHWPVFVLFHWTLGLESMINIFLALVFTLMSASLSFYYIENYFRYNKFLHEQKSNNIVLGALFSSVCFCVILGGSFFISRHLNLGLSLSNNQCIWMPHKIGCDNVALRENKPSRKIVVIGDSHAWAYTRMVNLAADRLNINFVSKYVYGCPILKLIEMVNKISLCDKSEKIMVNWIYENVNPGDVVFFASLRLARLGNQWGPFDAEKVFTDFLSDKQIIINMQALIDARHLISVVQEKQGIVLIDAPKPVFKSPIFRCLDWFNKSNPACANEFYIDKHWLLDFRKPVMDSLNLLISESGIEIWDPVPILCPSDKCPQIANGIPLFFDGDHLSGYGNRLLVDSFTSKLSQILGSN